MRNRILSLGALACTVLCTLGCDTERSYSDEGTLCAYGSRTDATSEVVGSTEFSVGQRIQLTYSLDDCLSSSCDTNRAASCSVIRDGNLLRVSSSASYTQSSQSECTEDCGRLSAICQSEKLPAGEYRVVHGTEEMIVTVPSTIEPPCASEP